MDKGYWQKQEPDKPLFPDLIWSRPEHKAQAGKLLIIGGHAQSFAAVASAYSSAEKAGIGTGHVLLPDVLQKTLSRIFTNGDYAPSTPSGSLSREALAVALDNAAWADGVMLAGDFGRNSETAILLEQFIKNYKGPLAITKDALDYFTNQPLLVLDRPQTLVVCSLAQLQKMSISAHSVKAFTFSMGVLQLVDTLHEFSKKHQSAIIVKHLDNIFVAINGSVTSTKLETEQSVWRVETCAKAITWWIQNLSRPFESITTSLVKA